MTPIFLDYETFWSVDHSLTKMSPITYVMHPNTEIISVAVKVGGGATEVLFGEDDIREYFDTVDWSDAMVVGHNLSGFDAMIHAWRFGIRPKMWCCTMAMARPLFAKVGGVSLKNVAERLGVGYKDSAALVNTKGKNLKDFTPDELRAMRVYNRDDTEMCAGIFKKLVKQYSTDELRVLDATIRMLVEPRFLVDAELLEQTLTKLREDKQHLLETLSDEFGLALEPDPAEAVRAMLASAPKFSKFLQSHGVDVPMKVSPKTGKPAPALAKTDEAFLALQEHENPLVAAAASARLGVKSTLLETRIEAFLSAAKATGGLLPVPLHYYGADTTGRWSGWAYNPQNLPRISGKPSDALRKSLRAPKGYKVVVADLSGIELRVNMFLWQAPYAMKLFQDNPDKADLYRYFAAKELYQIAESEVSKAQRQLGKVCIAEGTLLLCKHVGREFWVPIQEFKPEYQLWDGEDWVWAKGAVSNGWKQTQQLCGVSLTPDHLVLCGTTWLEARYVTGERIAQALATGAENLSLRAMLRAFWAASPRSWLSATVGFLSTRSKRAISRASNRRAATLAQSKQQVRSGTGSTSPLCKTTRTGLDYSTDYQQQSLAATRRATRTITTMAVEGSVCVQTGAKTAPSFFSTCRRFLGGMTPRLRWIAPTLMGTTSQETFGSSHATKTCETKGKFQCLSGVSQSLKHVFDILESGPRNCFTVLTDRGPMVVHNCHLGLGFGAGGPTFQKVAKIMGGIELSTEEATAIVRTYRAAHPEIAQGWKTCHAALEQVFHGVEVEIDPWGLCTTTREGIRTPRGMIRYPHLKREVNDEGKLEWMYGEGRKRTRIYAGKVDENIVQHLARFVVADNMVALLKHPLMRKHPPSLCVHDELVYVVPEEIAEEVLDTVQSVMRTPPDWWPQLVTWSEGDIADTYGDAK